MNIDRVLTGTALREQLQASLRGSYSLERELGGGGMSRVFLAEETALGRRVAVKVLAPELTEGVSAERFAREVRLAARLQHPNIVPVLTAGERDGLAYYTMPFVEGESLRARLAREGRLPVDVAVSLLRDVARALEYAHAQGVVHRDIEPENVLLAGSAAAVADFGIAKALDVARTVRTAAPGEAAAPPELETLTRVGTSLGTPAYMAPEQAAGDPDVDARADVYTWGVVAYELLAGAPPFVGRAAHQLVAAHIAEPPRPLAERAPGVPRALAALVMRCLEKDPARRPQSARDVLQVLDGIVPGTDAGTSLRARLTPLAAMTALVLAAVAAATALRTRGGAPSDRGSAVHAVAVLPFENASGDTASNYFAEGMTDELATALAKVPGLRVISRTSAYALRGRAGLDAPAIAERLHVGALIEGSVRRAGDRLRVTARLTRGGDGQSLWADAFTTDSGDVFAVQARLTEAIVAAVSPALAPASGRAIGPAGAVGAVGALGALGAAPGTKDMPAYDAYLRGRYELNRRGDGVRRSIPLFRQAIARDVSFAQAWAGLASAWAVTPDYAGVDRRVALDSVRRAAGRATALDSLLGEPYSALGYSMAQDGQYAAAEALLRRGVALDPRLDVAHRWLGLTYLYVGRYDLAEGALRAGLVVDPLSGVTTSLLAAVVAVDPARRQEARALARRAVALDAGNPVTLANAAGALFDTRDYDESLALVRRLPPRANGVVMLMTRLADLAAVGRRDSVATLLRDLERTPQTATVLWARATGAAALGQWDRAFAAADTAIATGRRYDPLVYLAALATRGARPAAARALRQDAAPLPVGHPHDRAGLAAARRGAVRRAIRGGSLTAMAGCAVGAVLQLTLGTAPARR